MIPSEILQQVLEAYGLRDAVAEPFGSGLINRTWKIAAGGRQFILQRINEDVFRSVGVKLKSIAFDNAVLYK